MTTRFQWERYRLADPEHTRYRTAAVGDPDPTLVLLRCSPVWWLVLEVVAEPARERGTWSARWRYQRTEPKSRGRAITIEEAQECALDAAEVLLADVLDQIEARRTEPLGPAEDATT